MAVDSKRDATAHSRCSGRYPIPAVEKLTTDAHPPRRTLPVDLRYSKWHNQRPQPGDEAATRGETPDG
jgi:hypothetical protein